MRKINKSKASGIIPLQAVAKEIRKKTAKNKQAESKINRKAIKDGYKDGYNCTKVYASKDVFLTDVKLAGKKETKFSVIFNAVKVLLAKNPKEAKIDVTRLFLHKKPIRYTDARMPRYVLGFLPNGSGYRIRDAVSKVMQSDREGGGELNGLVSFKLVKA